jgi:hypothetical protein
MFFLLKIPFEASDSSWSALVVALVCLLSVWSAPARAADRAYYSTGDSISVPSGGSRVELATKAQAAGLELTASIRPPGLISIGVFDPAVTVRLPLSGVAPVGYHAGIYHVLLHRAAGQVLGTQRLVVGN